MEETPTVELVAFDALSSFSKYRCFDRKYFIELVIVCAAYLVLSK